MSKEAEYEIKTPKIEEIPTEGKEENPLVPPSLPDEEEDDDDDHDEDLDDEDDDLDNEDDDEDYHPRQGILGKVLLCILAFLLGVAVTSYYFITFLQEEDSIPEEVPVESTPEPIPSTVDDLLPKGVAFGDTVTEMLLENPSLHALSDQGNHYGLFENDLEFPLDVSVSVGNIFYFYDENQAMHSLQYLLRPEDGALTTEEVTGITQELDEKYSIFYTGEGFSVWRCPDGFVGFQREMMYLYVTQDEVRVRGVFVEDLAEIS